MAPLKYNLCTLIHFWDSDICLSACMVIGCLHAIKSCVSYLLHVQASAFIYLTNGPSLPTPVQVPIYGKSQFPIRNTFNDEGE